LDRGQGYEAGIGDLDIKNCPPLYQGGLSLALADMTRGHGRWTVGPWGGLSSLLLLLWLVAVAPLARADMNDADQADAESDTSGTSDIDNMKDMSDPNILNPQRGQGYGNLDTNPPWRFTTTTPPPRTKVPTTPKPTFTQQSVTAVLEFGIIVSIFIINLHLSNLVNGQCLQISDGSSASTGSIFFLCLSSVAIEKSLKHRGQNFIKYSAPQTTYIHYHLHTYLYIYICSIF
jgi:hypothetical protein